MAHTVTAPLALVTDENGHVHYLYKGSVVPSYVTGEALKHLVDSGLVSTEKAAAKASASQPSQAPAGNASLEDWQEWGRTQGATDADLDGKTRDELRKQFG